MVIDRDGGKWTLVDFSLPFHPKVSNKEQEKVKKYERLASEVSRMHGGWRQVVPIVVGALGVVPKRLDGWLKRLGIGDWWVAYVCHYWNCCARTRNSQVP